MGCLKLDYPTILHSLILQIYNSTCNDDGIRQLSK